MNLNTAKLRDISYRKSLRQIKIAEVTGISRASINGIFCGRSCRKETATKIAGVLGVPLESLIVKGE